MFSGKRRSYDGAIIYTGKLTGRSLIGRHAGRQASMEIAVFPRLAIQIGGGPIKEIFCDSIACLNCQNRMKFGGCISVVPGF